MNEIVAVNNEFKLNRRLPIKTNEPIEACFSQQK